LAEQERPARVRGATDGADAVVPWKALGAGDYGPGVVPPLAEIAVEILDGMRGTMRRHVLLILAVAVIIAQPVDAQVTSDRLVTAAREPQNWLTYGGGYDSQRYSLLNRITPANAKDLELKWVYQTFSTHSFQTTPIVVDGSMYMTCNPNNIHAHT